MQVAAVVLQVAEEHKELVRLAVQMEHLAQMQPQTLVQVAVEEVTQEMQALVVQE
jgi:hypothetical protein